MSIRIAILSLVLAVITGCNRSSILPPATNSTQSTRLNATPKTAAPTARSQRLEPGETAAVRGYNDGYGDASVAAPRNPDQWLPQLGFAAADQQIYRDQYNRGYDSVSPTSPTPTPTGSVTPERRTELQRLGYQAGLTAAQSGFGANPDGEIYTLGLTNPTEIEIYTAAYNSGYQQRPSPLPSSSPERLTELKQDGYQDGYNAARSNVLQDTSSGIRRLGLVSATERQAYIDGYGSGYRAYTASVQPPINGSVLW